MARKLTRAEQAEAETQFTPLSDGKRSFGEIISTFWEDHRAVLIVALVLICLGIPTVIYLSQPIEADLKILFVSSQYALPSDTEEDLEHYLMRYTTDRNGDAIYRADVIAGYYDGGTDAVLTDSKKEQKATLEEVLAGDEIYVIIADEATINWLRSEGQLTTFGSIESEEIGALDPAQDCLRLGDTLTFTYFSDAQAYGYSFEFAENDGMAEAFADYYLAIRTYTDADATAVQYAVEYLEAMLRHAATAAVSQ